LKKKDGIAIELSRGGENMSPKARRILALLNDPRHRERLLQSMNQDTLDDVGPIDIAEFLHIDNGDFGPYIPRRVSTVLRNR
jgi:hypothetical protein